MKHTIQKSVFGLVWPQTQQVKQDLVDTARSVHVTKKNKQSNKNRLTTTAAIDKLSDQSPGQENLLWTCHAFTNSIVKDLWDGRFGGNKKSINF